MADRLANSFRLLAECEAPKKYFMEAEERFILTHDGMVIQGDPRLYLKKFARTKMMDIWKEKCEKQGEWVTKKQGEWVTNPRRNSCDKPNECGIGQLKQVTVRHGFTSSSLPVNGFLQPQTVL